MAAIQQAFASYKGVVAVTYATWNPADKATNTTLSNGNLTITNGTDNNPTRSTISKTSGKWYWEVKRISGVNFATGVANSTATLTNYCGSDINAIAYYSSGDIYNNAIIITTFASTAVNDVIGYALDADAKTITLYKNNVLAGTVTISTYFSGAIFAAGAGAGVSTANFGATALTYTPPSGFNAGLYN